MLFFLFFFTTKETAFSPLQGYGQALKQKDYFSGVLGDDCLPISWTSSVTMSSDGH